MTNTGSSGAGLTPELFHTMKSLFVCVIIHGVEVGCGTRIYLKSLTFLSLLRVNFSTLNLS